MSLGRTRSVALHGLHGAVVDVEADVAQGLPSFTVTGMPDQACAQSRDRVKAAAANSGVPIPARRITINLSPASLPKSGSGFDLPIAVASLAAAGVVPGARVEDVVHLGELSLDGTVRPLHGVLPAVLAASRAGIRHVVVPAANVGEASLVPGVRVQPATTLSALVAHYVALAQGRRPFDDGPSAAPLSVAGSPDDEEPAPPDLADIVGQDEARFALEVAAAGGHHLFLLGPPGAGKTMLAERLPGLLPPLDIQQALEVTAIHSVLGLLPSGTLIRRAPFVAPHHGASLPAVVGGGSGVPKPGAISRAHHGVLFLDESPEFKASVLNALRQPIEKGEVVVARANSVVRYPARFQLVLAANPCPCGRAVGKGADCRCAPKALRDYLGKLAGPVLDRVDIQLQVHAIRRLALVDQVGESSGVVAGRVAVARARQRERLQATPWRLNAEVPGPELRHGSLRLPRAATMDIERALERQVLTLRGYDRVLRLAWTISDLAGDERPTRHHVGAALTLRSRAAVPA